MNTKLFNSMVRLGEIFEPAAPLVQLLSNKENMFLLESLMGLDDVGFSDTTHPTLPAGWHACFTFELPVHFMFEFEMLLQQYIQSAYADTNHKYYLISEKGALNVYFHLPDNHRYLINTWRTSIRNEAGYMLDITEHIPDIVDCYEDTRLAKSLTVLLRHTQRITTHVKYIKSGVLFAEVSAYFSTDVTDSFLENTILGTAFVVKQPNYYQLKYFVMCEEEILSLTKVKKPKSA